MNNDKNLLKFHGKFTDLIPYGFKFQKLFANNYRQYCLELSPYGESISVWQAHGGYIEIEDWYSATKGVVAAVFNPSFKWHRFDNTCGFTDCDSLGFTIVRETKEVIPLDYDIHDSAKTYWHMTQEGKSKEEIQEAIRAICGKYRVERLSQDMLAKIRELHAKGWIKV
jgi:hypothetical protein